MYEEPMIMWFEKPGDLLEHVIHEAEYIRDKGNVPYEELNSLEERICAYRAAKVY